MSISLASFWTVVALAVAMTMNIFIPWADRSDIALGIALLALYCSYRNERA